MTFGEKLKYHRLEKGLKQTELAKLAGLGLNTISNYELGKTRPQDHKIYKVLADILEIDADYLHNDNDDFINTAMEAYGSRGKKQAKQLMEDVTGLFAGGDMADEDLDEFMRAVQEAYWLAKDKNKKYTRKDYTQKS